MRGNAPAGIVICFILFIQVSSCSTSVHQFYEGKTKERSQVARIRSTKRAFIKSINGKSLNDRFSYRNDYSTNEVKSGDWYELLPDTYNVEVYYAGFYTHYNPEYCYIYIGDKISGPFIKKRGSELYLDMISAQTDTITIILEAGKEYEVRAQLTINPNRPFVRPWTPELIAPRNPTLFIVKDLVNLDEFLPVLRESEIKITEFKWEAYIVEVGSDEDIEDQLPQNQPLARAIEAGQAEFAEFLIAAGEDIDIELPGKLTPLHNAASLGQKDVVDKLIKKGADVNARSQTGMTPLHLAAESGYGDIVNILIANGAQVDARNDMKATPLFYAAGNGHAKTVSILLDNGADSNARQSIDWTALHHAAHGGHDEVVSILIAHGAKLNIKSDIGLTPLMIAVNEKHPSTMKLLIEAGADIDCRDNEGWSPLHYAALNDLPDEMAELLAAGASPCLPNKRFCTPLHNAALEGDTVCIRMLLNAGCDVNAKMKNGWTALHMAALNARASAIQLLLDQGANVNARSVDGETPLFLANRKGNVICAHTLESHGGVE